MLDFSPEFQVVSVLSICLITVFFVNLISKRLKLPLIIAPLIVGLALNFLQYHIKLFPYFGNILEIFANFGIILVLFFIGLKVNFRFVRDLTKNASIMALNAGIIPFLLGFFATLIYTEDIIKSAFVGLAIAITAEEVSISILEELKMLKTKIGQLVIETGIIGDIFEIGAITFLAIIIKARAFPSASPLFHIIVELGLFLTIIILLRYYVIELLLRIIGKDGRKYEYFGVAIVVLLIMTLASELLNFSYIIGALLAGLLLKDKFTEDKLYYEEHHVAEAIETFNFGFFEQLVFVWIGFSIDTSILFANIGFGLVLTILALGGKLAGSMIGNYFCNQPIKEGYLIGWGLNARGATELFAVLIAKNIGVIGENLFSAIVFMTLVTTIISPIVFKYLVSKGYGLHRKYKKATRIELSG
jgi:Kef-type K+ transport system membrane component KefB